MRKEGRRKSWTNLEIEESYLPMQDKIKKKDKKFGIAGAILIVCFITLPLLAFLFSDHLSSKMPWLHDARITTREGLFGNNSSQTPNRTENRLVDGLISPNFNKQSCLSRLEESLYRKISPPYMPSSCLLHKLRNYEELHMKCGPNTPLYQKSILLLNSGRNAELMDCNYIVWIPYNGLGNRILSLISTFLYALLTNRVLLIHQTEDLLNLFCEPFPNSSWVLPSDFPIKNLTHLNVFSDKTYGNMLDKHVISNDPKTKVESLPPYVYLHLEHDYHHLDRLFFCNDDQIVLNKVNWLLLQSDIYFVPSLFSIPLFEDELQWLFPEKESIFNLLARHLMHPSNSVWGMVKRFYLSYLDKAEKKIGIQIRIFRWSTISPDHMFGQILNCSKMQNILAEIDLNETKPIQTGALKSEAILLTSLYKDYYDKFKSMYYEHSVKTGEFIGVYQPSYEGKQHTEQQSHNQKALAEIYLLSLCDVLVTSGVSTFGYVSQGLAGIKPVFLMSGKGDNVPDPPCVRAVSMEPCHHAPPKINCRGKMVEKQKLEKYVKQCEDYDEGIKLFD